MLIVNTRVRGLLKKCLPNTVSLHTLGKGGINEIQ
jgi:hypothetical protein